MGLHFGEVVMGHVGAMDHYEYRAVGDIVNTASRIEGLNKQLGTRILVSHEVLDGLDGFLSREVGMFRLVGKSKPLTLYELIAERANQADMPNIDYSLFSRALLAFQEKRWYDALDGFSSFIARYGEDGPSRYYLALNEQYRMSPPENWDGVVKLARK
jgi:adenylate cyclase